MHDENQVRLTRDGKKKEERLFQFDLVCDGTNNQEDVYSRAKIPSMVKKVVDGYHSTIFAYGQTGSGKTYTMEGYHYV